MIKWYDSNTTRQELQELTQSQKNYQNELEELRVKLDVKEKEVKELKESLSISKDLEEKVEKLTNQNAILRRELETFQKEFTEIQISRAMSGLRKEREKERQEQLEKQRQKEQAENINTLRDVQTSTNNPIQNGELVEFEVTMYTNAGGAPPYQGKMANGEYTHTGVVAGPKSLPFGTIVQFTNMPPEWSELDIPYVVKDRGGAIVEKYENGKTIYCIDIWTDKGEEYAKSWGRRRLTGYIIN